MTVASEIARLQAAKVDIMAALVEKGVDVSGKNLVDVPSLIDSIVVDNHLIYETDFSNFDLTTLIDIPKVGISTQWVKTRSGYSIQTRTIDDTEYTGLYIDQGLIHTDIAFNNTLPDVFTIECTSYKDRWEGIGMGLMVFGIRCPFYNCYSSDRGLGALCSWYASKLYNNASSMYDKAYIGSWYNKNEMSKIRTCGVTVDFINNTVKAYIEGKKLLSISQQPLSKSNEDAIRFWGDANNYGSNFFALNMKIYDYDKFEDMEG